MQLLVIRRSEVMSREEMGMVAMDKSEVMRNTEIISNEDMGLVKSLDKWSWGPLKSGARSELYFFFSW